MLYVLDSPGKINLTLRITGIRNNGMHDLASLFMRLSTAEKLTFRFLDGDNVNKDVVRVHGQVIRDRNILERVLQVARKSEPHLPFMEVDIWKQVPPGSGLGAGSGNAAALIRWLSRELGVSFPFEEVAGIGSDVPFLLEGSPFSFRVGVGDRIFSDVPDPWGSFKGVIAIPEWSCDTRATYGMADEFFREGWELTEEEALSETLEILGSLERQERVGLLPNDFVPVLEALHPEYSLLFEAAEAGGALAWGVSGSGSSFFCIFGVDRPVGLCAKMLERTGIVRKILALG